MFRLIEWENVCLVCLQKGANRYIFEGDNDSNVIADKIMKCSDILIKRDTNEPRNICSKCLNDLNVAYKLRRTCEQSFSIIKTLLNTPRQESDIKDLRKTASTISNPKLDICIKDEIVHNAVVDDTCENISTSLDLEYRIDTKSKSVDEVPADTCALSNTMEVNNENANKSNKTEEEMDCEISGSRQRPKKLISKSYADGSVKTAFKNKQKICEICGRSFRRKGLLDKHMRRHQNKGPFNCDHCDKAFVRRGSLRRHLRVHTGDKPLKCQYCDRRFSDYGVRKNHESTHTGERPYVCPTCGNSFAYRGGLTMHLHIHTDIKKFVCRECGKGFMRKLLFEKHVSRHLTRDKLYKSSEHKQNKLIEKEILQIEKNANSNEINTKHEIVNNAVLDDTCDNKFTVLDLENRIDTESKSVDEVPAGTCALSNAMEVNNEKANESHKTEEEMNCEISRSSTRPFSCDHCDKPFGTLKKLQRHVILHTGHKPLKCQYCDRRFSHYGVRKNHESTHTGERPYICPVCGNSFAHRSGLTKHLRIHNGAKPFECKECGKGFMRKLIFEKHVSFHLARDELDKSSQHKPNERLPKEIFQIEENVNSNEINIKHEIVEIAEFGDNCEDGNTSCVDLKSDPGTIARDDKIIQLPNGEIPKTGVSLKVCGICCRGFKNQFDLHSHMRRHNNERPFSCDDCDKTFVARAGLQRHHLVVHNGQKPLKCQYCDRRFSDYSVRKNHESTHTGERPYVCQTCGRGFGYSKSLTLHLRTHTISLNKEGEKEFVKNVLFEKQIVHHLTRDELDKSSEHKQMKRLEKNIDQTEVCTNANENEIKREVEPIEEEDN